MNGESTPIDSDEDDGTYHHDALNRDSNNTMPKPFIGRFSSFESINFPILERGFSLLQAQDELKPLSIDMNPRGNGNNKPSNSLSLAMPEIRRNNSLYLDGETPVAGAVRSNSVLPKPALVTTSSLWEFDRIFDVSAITLIFVVIFNDVEEIA